VGFSPAGQAAPTDGAAHAENGINFDENRVRLFL
jgi:PHD/YefM family antitoxin component YafN of YafNO toxin-antitoxin module